MGDINRQQQKKIVLDKWDELIKELSIYIEQTCMYGGTMSHKTGSLKDQQIRLKELFQNL